jgi:sodium/hydrogen exchanger 8
MQVFGTLTPPLIAWLYPPHLRSNRSDGSDNLSPKASLDADFHIPLLMDTNGDREQDGENGPNDRIPINQYLRDLTRLESLSMLLTAPRSTIHHVWRKFDDSYMRPTFGGRGYVRLMSRRGMESPAEDEELEDEDRD